MTYWLAIIILSQIAVPHGGDYEDCDFLGPITLYFRDNSTYRRNISPTYLESKGKSSKKLSEAGLTCCVLVWFMLRP
jgi:hypothetical protein